MLRKHSQRNWINTVKISRNTVQLRPCFSILALDVNKADLDRDGIIAKTRHRKV